MSETPEIAPPPRTVDYALFERDSGRIVATGRCREDRVEVLADMAYYGVLTEVWARDAIHCVIDGAIVERTPLPGAETVYTLAADGVDSVSIPVPVGATCWMQGRLSGPPWTEASGTARITTNVAGVYELVVDHPRHLVARIRIEAT
jgi:hypothetical protein